MAWVNDLVAGFGIPAGAATLAVAIYAACAAAEKAARPEALREVGRIISHTSWASSVQPSEIIERVFVWTFGERHLSWRCVTASVLATSYVVIALSLVREWTNGLPLAIRYIPESIIDQLVWGVTNNKPLSAIVRIVHTILPFCIIFSMMALAPDFISLGKARYLLTRSHKVNWYLLPLIDIVLSIVISFAFSLILFWVCSYYLSIALAHKGEPHNPIMSDLMMGFALIASGVSEGMQSSYFPEPEMYHHLGQLSSYVSDQILGIHHSSADPLPLLPALFCSTLFTSIWTILILLATTVLKLLAPLQRFTAWFFDVEHHPVKVIGIVSAALLMIGSLIWALLRAVTGS